MKINCVLKEIKGKKNLKQNKILVEYVLIR